MMTLLKTLAKTLAWVSLGGLYRLAAPFLSSSEVVILCYHSVSDHPHWTAVGQTAFARQLELLSTRGCVFVSLNQVLAWLDGTGTLPRRAVALTFDDGYADFETTVLPLLQKYNAPAALFVVEGNIGKERYLTRDALARVRTCPLVEVGFHTYTHPNLSKLSLVDIDTEVASPVPAAYFAYPGGNHSPEAARALARAGYKAAFTIRPVLVRQGMDRYFLPRVVVTQSMSAPEVALRASKAADWYYSLTH